MSALNKMMGRLRLISPSRSLAWAFAPHQEVSVNDLNQNLIGCDAGQLHLDDDGL